MSGKPKTIPSLSRERGKASDSKQTPTVYDQNRGNKGVSQIYETRMTSSSDAPTDENFVNDDIIEENSHVIPPTRKAAGKRASKGKSASQ